MFPSQPSVSTDTSPVAESRVLGTTAATVMPIGTRTKTASCVGHDAMPDQDCSPGQALEGVTKEQVCVSGYAKSVRNVGDSEKKAVYAEYGIPTHAPGEYEVDHIISLELGGSNDIANLWPEPAEPRPGFHEKDTVENFLHNEVCSGQVTLQEAQSEIAHDWRGVYDQIAAATH